jgi:hypothetical protein
MAQEDPEGGRAVRRLVPVRSEVARRAEVGPLNVAPRNAGNRARAFLNGAIPRGGVHKSVARRTKGGTESTVVRNRTAQYKTVSAANSCGSGIAPDAGLRMLTASLSRGRPDIPPNAMSGFARLA